ncbi:SIR2 family histone deacetylase [Penicillium capsulatum]|uniref:SIR2 family histone deacetylase n=1 Tax=Penicillium capsulatum TaxID=69766 RepID=A0A9W9IAD3_9EURO|nr:SIR2 family histone deacetylase [Penicillium capsulatum]KAJ6134965.1 SIR2 family histone deacetylase [Penicillium capsulatum]
MASSAKSAIMCEISAADLKSFQKHLKCSKRILVLLGAGLSASSGLPTFRGAGGLWRLYDATSLATPGAFNANPGLVWQFYGYRRHMALQANPNRAHLALAEMARRNKDFITLSQNVDGLSQRAEHPPEQLHLLHGSLFNIKCSRSTCDYTRDDDFTDPIVPALAIPQLGPSPSATGEEASELMKQAIQRKATASPDEASGKDDISTETPPKDTPSDGESSWEDVSSDEDSSAGRGALAVGLSSGKVDISDARVAIPDIDPKDLPQCPKCHGLLRPGVVWFGEALPVDTLDAVEEWIETASIDLMLVIGTSAFVTPAAGYIDTARDQGARIAVINMDPNDETRQGLGPDDWFFQGDAAVIVPELLKEIIGDI